jgi:hypothetical protein
VVKDDCGSSVRWAIGSGLRSTYWAKRAVAIVGTGWD